MRNAAGEAQITAIGYFNFCVPLCTILLGFWEDYKCMMINARYELILIRARNNNNCLMGDPTVEPNYSKYRMLHILLSKINKLAMLRALESERYLSMAFCSYRCVYEIPLLQDTSIRGPSKPIKIATQLEKQNMSIEKNVKQIDKNVMSENIIDSANASSNQCKFYLNSG